MQKLKLNFNLRLEYRAFRQLEGTKAIPYGPDRNPWSCRFAEQAGWRAAFSYLPVELVRSRPSILSPSETGIPAVIRGAALGGRRFFRSRNTALFKKFLDIAVPKPLYPPYCITRQFAAIDHSVDGHFGELQEVGQLANCIKFPRLRSHIRFPLLHSLFGSGFASSIRTS